MLSIAEIAHNTRGALRMLQLDPAAPFEFENTAEFCLRSFRVIVLAAPLYVFYVLIHYTRFESPADEGEIVLVEGLRYVVDWLLYPVVFHEIARRRGWLGLYPRYIAALNWINLPAIIIAVMGTAVATVAPSPFSSLVLIVLQGLFFYWFLVTTRLVLNVSWPIAVLLLVINWVPTMFLSLLVDRLLGVAAT